jgi:signal transduction histidine kinase
MPVFAKTCYSESTVINISRIWQGDSKFQGQLVFALIVIVLVPIIFVVNVVWMMRSYERDLNYALRQQSAIVAEVIHGAYELYNQKGQSAQIDTLIGQMLAKSERINSVSIIAYRLDSGEVAFDFASDELVAEADARLSTARYVSGKDDPLSERVQNPRTGQYEWAVTRLIENGEVRKVLVVRVAADDLQQLMIKMSQESLVVLLAIVGILLVVLFNHFRFFDHAMANLKLKKASELKDNFLSTAAHELRTPMTIIQGYVEAMRLSLDNREELALFLNNIDKSVERLKNLVEDLLNVSRLEQGRVKLNLTRFDLVSKVNEVVNEFESIAREKGLRIEQHPPSERVFVNCDADKMHEVLVNLVGNAVKYTLKGTVQISYEINKDTVQVQVKDSGVGMSAQEREALFNKFYRIRNADTEKIDGTGLGLWIVKEYLRLMKGKIDVDSIKGEGSVFYVTLPKEK